jgi:hypothetical protein
VISVLISLAYQLWYEVVFRQVLTCSDMFVPLQARMAWGIHGLPKVTLGPTMPYYPLGYKGVWQEVAMDSQSFIRARHALPFNALRAGHP